MHRDADSSSWFQAEARQSNACSHIQHPYNFSTYRPAGVINHHPDTVRRSHSWKVTSAHFSLPMQVAGLATITLPQALHASSVSMLMCFPGQGWTAPAGPTGLVLVECTVDGPHYGVTLANSEGLSSPASGPGGCHLMAFVPCGAALGAFAAFSFLPCFPGSAAPLAVGAALLAAGTSPVAAGDPSGCCKVAASGPADRLHYLPHQERDNVPLKQQALLQAHPWWLQGIHLAAARLLHPILQRPHIHHMPHEEQGNVS